MKRILRRPAGTAKLALIVSIMFCASCTDAPSNPNTAGDVISESERAVLLELFRSTGGERWTRRDWWGATRGTECKWHGVGCSTQKPVTVLSLDLRDNNLTGQLPPTLSNLSWLIRLHLEGNHLTGRLPADLLQAFDRGEMQLTGYTGQFSPVSEIQLISRSAGSICTEYEASVRADGTVTVGRQRCTSRFDKYWERGTGEIDLYEVDRLVRLFETVGFEQFSPKYLWGVDHAEAVTLRLVYKDGSDLSVFEFAATGPPGFWLLKRAMAGMAFGLDIPMTSDRSGVRSVADLTMRSMTSRVMGLCARGNGSAGAAEQSSACSASVLRAGAPAEKPTRLQHAESVITNRSGEAVDVALAADVVPVNDILVDRHHDDCHRRCSACSRPGVTRRLEITDGK